MALATIDDEDVALKLADYIETALGLPDVVEDPGATIAEVGKDKKAHLDIVGLIFAGKAGEAVTIIMVSEDYREMGRDFRGMAEIAAKDLGVPPGLLLKLAELHAGGTPASEIVEKLRKGVIL